jgi:glycosyltransferase involved in cell wall biosynthesis
MKISVIIPTYNRVSTLCQSLRSLQDQSFRDFEILVVDNAADPAVARKVTEFSDTAVVPARYLAEPTLGVHFARHTGARAARGKLLVFTDDDVTFDADWLRAYADAFNRHPHMAAAGGPSRPVWETPPPAWLLQYLRETELWGVFSLMEPFEEFRMDEQAFFWSLNMAIRREALFAVGGFNPEACGEIWLGDGESGLNHKLRERRMPIGYVPQALVHHHIPLRRMTPEYLCLRMANQEACEIYTSWHRGVPHSLRLCKHALAVALKNCRWLVGAWFVKGRTDARSLNIQIHAARAWCRLKYTARLIADRGFRDLVRKEDWLVESCDPVQSDVSRLDERSEATWRAGSDGDGSCSLNQKPGSDGSDPVLNTL